MPLDGGRSNDEPTTWTAKPPEEAMEWLKTEAMVVPGYLDHDWSKGWKPAVVKKQREFSDLSMEAEYRYFQLNETQAHLVEDRLAQEVMSQFDCDLDVVPANKRGEVMELLEMIVREVKRSGFGASGG